MRNVKTARAHHHAVSPHRTEMDKVTSALQSVSIQCSNAILLGAGDRG